MDSDYDQNSAVPRHERRRPPRLEWAGRLSPEEIRACVSGGEAPQLVEDGRLPGNSEAVDALLIQGENGRVLRALESDWSGKLDFVYLDPPFFSGTARKAEVLVGGERVERPAYEDPAGDLGSYLGALEERLVQIRELLAAAGTLCLHVDQRLHPYARLILDELFGAKNLINDVVWSYRSGGGSRRRFGLKHDNLLLYAKSPDYYFDADAARVPYDAVIAAKRAHLFHPDGKVAGDVWDINRPANHAKELTGYPTQKPLALLERLVATLTPAGGTVGDFFAGSGTTGVAAQRLGRNFILADASPTALNVMLKRFAAEAADHCDRGGRARGIRILRLAETAPPPNGGTAEACLMPLGSNEMVVELLTYRPDVARLSPEERSLAERNANESAEGLELVDLWAVDFTGGNDDGPFHYDWLDYRLPRKPRLQTGSMPWSGRLGESGSVRVRVIDAFGHRSDLRLSAGIADPGGGRNRG